MRSVCSFAHTGPKTRIFNCSLSHMRKKPCRPPLEGVSAPPPLANSIWKPCRAGENVICFMHEELPRHTNPPSFSKPEPQSAKALPHASCFCCMHHFTTACVVALSHASSRYDMRHVLPHASVLCCMHRSAITFRGALTHASSPYLMLLSVTASAVAENMHDRPIACSRRYRMASLSYPACICCMRRSATTCIQYAKLRAYPSDFLPP